MPDGPFKSMTPDPTTQRRESDSLVEFMKQPRFRCAECEQWVYLGDWPFCGPSGHKR